MPGLRSKIIHRIKTHDNLKLNEQRQSIAAITKRTEMLELHDKDLKSAMISNGDANIEKRFLATVGEREGGMISESSTETYTLPYVK